MDDTEAPDQESGIVVRSSRGLLIEGNAVQVYLSGALGGRASAKKGNLIAGASSFLPLGDGEREIETAAGSRPAFGPDSPAMRIDDSLCDRETEPRSLTIGPARLPEPVERM